MSLFMIRKCITASGLIVSLVFRPKKDQEQATLGTFETIKLNFLKIVIKAEGCKP